MKRDRVARIVYAWEALKKVERSLHHLGEVECNQGLSKAQTTREKNLRAKAEGLAKGIGMKCYFQTDPRGCALYVFFLADLPKPSAEWKICEVYNTHGIACCG